jgi:hypothetical protein
MMLAELVPERAILMHGCARELPRQSGEGWIYGVGASATTAYIVRAIEN